MPRPTILLTNDDGIASPALLSLRRVLEPLGTVITIAPDRNYSAVARGITIDRALRIEPLTFGEGFYGNSVDGTPVDCVRVAMLGFFGPAPDFVVAGVNNGANLGDDVTYSGTVAAALEGVLLGLPAAAVSVAAREPRFLDRTAGVVVPFIRRAIEDGLPPRTLVNINLPELPLAAIKGVRLTHLGRASYHDRLVVESGDGTHNTYSMKSVKDGDADHEAGSDFEAVESGYVSVTPLRFDLSSEPGERALAGWDLAALFAEVPRQEQ
jgi:5'-nucleotidase